MSRRLLRVLPVATGLGIGGILAGAEPAPAAMWVRMEVDPAAPVAGEEARVSVMTFYLMELRCAGDPAAKPIPFSDWTTGDVPYPDLTVGAVGPDGVSTIRLPLKRRESHPAYWDGSVVFPAPGGEWTLRVTRPDFGKDEACAGAKTTVVVEPPGEAGRPAVRTDALVLSAALLLAAGLAPPMIMWLRRST